jgi:hypothetical protein
MKEPDNRQVLCMIELAFCGKISGLPFFCVAGYLGSLRPFAVRRVLS